jgi:phage tail tape-measure protein
MTNNVDELRIKYGFWIVVIGLLVIGAVFGLSVSKWAAAADVATAAGPVTSVIGTLVGAFFGVQLGAAGKDKAEEKALHLASALPPDKATQVLESLRQEASARPQG